MSRTVPLLGVLAAAVVLGSCGGLEGSCQQNNVPGVHILVELDPDGDRDARNALATVTEGSFVDTMTVTQVVSGIPTALGGAYDRPGSYFLCVKKPGFDDYVQPNIAVSGGPCGVVTQAFIIRMKLSTGALPC